MQVKILEIRDSGTFIPCLAVDMHADNPMQWYYLERCGYPGGPHPNIAISHLAANGTKLWNDPYAWHGRTWPVAHNYIIDNWDSLKDGDVIDVEFILKETPEPKASERIESISAVDVQFTVKTTPAPKASES